MLNRNSNIDAMYINDVFEDGRVEYCMGSVWGGCGNPVDGEFITIEGKPSVETYRVVFYYNNGVMFDNKNFSESKSIERLRRNHGEDPEGPGKDISA